MRYTIKCHTALYACTFALGCSRPDPVPSSALAWTAEPRWTVGGESNRGLSLSELHDFQVAAAPNRVAIIDRPARRLFLLDSTGTVRDTLGRSGAGPGEFVDPWSVAIDSRGFIFVVDLGARVLTSWSGDLELQRPASLQLQLESPRLRFHEGHPVMLAVGVGASKQSEYLLVELTDGGEIIRSTLPRPPRRVADFPSCSARNITVTPLFAPAIVWDAAQSTLAVSAGGGYPVVVREGETKTGELAREIPVERATQAMALEAARDWKFNDCLVPPGEVVRALSWFETIPVLEDLIIASDNLVWVKRRDGEASAIDIFTSTGVFRGTLEKSFPFPAAFLDQDHFVAISKDSLEIPVVTGYELVRP